MADVHKWPDVDRVKDEASRWVVRLHAGDVSANDKSQFEAWCNAHPLHMRTYEEISATWQEYREAAPLVRALSMAEASSAVAAVKQSSRRLWLAAASAAMFAVAGAVFYFSWLAAGAMHSTMVGEQATVRLPDGSAMDLNSNSRARVQFTADVRVIRLEQGEAFFKVAHDTNRPFWVVSGNSWVRAVGTAFNVYVRPSGVQVTVSEGVVKVGAAKSALTMAPSDAELEQTLVSLLKAGEQVSIGDAAHLMRALNAGELARFIAWRSGSLYFEQQPLGEVVDELNRYTQIRMVIANENLRNLSIGGSFEANPKGAEALLTALQDGLALRVRREADRAYIESPKDQ